MELIGRLRRKVYYNNIIIPITQILLTKDLIQFSLFLYSFMCVYSPMQFISCIDSCIHHQNQIQNYSFPQRNSLILPLCIHTLFFLSWGNHQSVFQLYISVMWQLLYKQSQIFFDWCLFFSKHSALGIHPGCCMYIKT